MSADFFEEDLLNNNTAPDYSLPEEEDDVEVVQISEVGLNRLARQREEVSNKVAGAVQKIEHLRSRQDTLERERQELEELARKQEEYEAGKTEMRDKLSRWIVRLEKERVQAARMVELLNEAFEKFKEVLHDIEMIDESSWSHEDFQLELNRALVKVDIARSTFTKAMAKIEAASWHKQIANKDQFEVGKEAGRETGAKKGFGYWLMVGFAVTLPLIIVLLAIFGAWLHFAGVFGV